MVPHGETPVGEVCPKCDKPIEPAHQGFILPYISDDQDVTELAYHRFCMLEMILGPNWKELVNQ